MPEGRKPDYIASTVVGDGAKARWRELGVAFTNRDGSITIMLDALPVAGKLVLQQPKPKERENRA